MKKKVPVGAFHHGEPENLRIRKPRYDSLKRSNMYVVAVAEGTGLSVAIMTLGSCSDTDHREHCSTK